MGNANIFAQAGAAQGASYAAQQEFKGASRAALKQASEEFDELERRKGVADEAAQEDKSDRVRSVDKAVAAMLAYMADNGSTGTGTPARFAAEAHFLAGIDLARIEGNRRREIDALSSGQRAATVEAISSIQEGHKQTMVAIGRHAAMGADVAFESQRRNPARERGRANTDPAKGGTADSWSPSRGYFTASKAEQAEFDSEPF